MKDGFKKDYEICGRLYCSDDIPIQRIDFILF